MLFALFTLKAQQTGTLMDKRDGKTYKTVKIGNQWWMAENLAYKVNSGCRGYGYGDVLKESIDKFGYLYTYETAKEVCPDGWYLPSTEEWTTLTNYLGGKDSIDKLRSVNEWYNNNGGNNSSGFNALPGGQYMPDYNEFSGKGVFAAFWTGTACDSDRAMRRILRGSDLGYGKFFIDCNTKDYEYSVRCIKE